MSSIVFVIRQGKINNSIQSTMQILPLIHRLNSND